MQLSNLKARLAAKTILQLNGPPPQIASPYLLSLLGYNIVLQCWGG